MTYKNCNIRKYCLFFFYVFIFFGGGERRARCKQSTKCFLTTVLSVVGKQEIPAECQLCILRLNL